MFAAVLVQKRARFLGCGEDGTDVDQRRAIEDEPFIRSRPQGRPDVGKFTLTLRKGADGRWLIFSDMDNGNRPSR